jgi:DNA-binding XRE family transcriptional regulator
MPPNNQGAFMNRLKMWRLERSLSQMELAQAASISRWKIQLTEGGHYDPDDSERSALARVLDINETLLFPSKPRKKADV